MIHEYNNSQNYPQRLQETEDAKLDKSKIPTHNLGKFITLEGGEGCGKSTQSKMLYEHLNAKGIKVLLTREVGGTLEAEKIRDILLNSELLTMTEVMLVMAARFEHLNKLIIPALKKGVWMICDRFIDSTAAYQGKNSDIGIDKIFAMHNEIIGELLPDLTFFIDLAPEIALRRAKSRGDINKFENKELEFHASVHKGFLEISKKFKERVVRIKAGDRSREEIHADILSKLAVH